MYIQSQKVIIHAANKPKIKIKSRICKSNSLVFTLSFFEIVVYIIDFFKFVCTVN